MSGKNRYYRGIGYHVDLHAAETFADKYIGEDGGLINLDSCEFKTDLEVFVSSHCLVEEAHRTIETENICCNLKGSTYA